MKLNAKLLCKTADEDDDLVKELTQKQLIEIDRHKDYGQELILDIHDVARGRVHAKGIKKFAADLCDEIGMSKGPSFVWGTDSDKDEWKDPKADGISCVQFLHSSSITIHAIDLLNRVFINIFSCKSFDAEKAKAFTMEHFGGKISSEHNIVRK